MCDTLKEKKISLKVSEVEKLRDKLNYINSLNLDNINLTSDDDEIIEIDKSLIEQFKYTGLNNVDFIVSGFYKTGFEH